MHPFQPIKCIRIQCICDTCLLALCLLGHQQDARSRNGIYRNDRMRMNMHHQQFICSIYEIEFISLKKCEEVYHFTVPQYKAYCTLALLDLCQVYIYLLRLYWIFPRQLTFAVKISSYLGGHMTSKLLLFIVWYRFDFTQIIFSVLHFIGLPSDSKIAL